MTKVFHIENISPLDMEVLHREAQLKGYNNAIQSIVDGVETNERGQVWVSVEFPKGKEYLTSLFTSLGFNQEFEEDTLSLRNPSNVPSAYLDVLEASVEGYIQEIERHLDFGDLNMYYASIEEQEPDVQRPCDTE